MRNPIQYFYGLMWFISPQLIILAMFIVYLLFRG